MANSECISEQVTIVDDKCLILLGGGLHPESSSQGSRTWLCWVLFPGCTSLPLSDCSTILLWAAQKDKAGVAEKVFESRVSPFGSIKPVDG